MKKIFWTFLIIAAMMSAVFVNAHAEEVEYNSKFNEGSTENWTLGTGVALNGSSIANDWNNIHSISVFEQYQWSSPYTYEVDFYNEGNSGNANIVKILFNYQDEYNYYSVNIGGGPAGTENDVVLKKNVSGNEVEIKRSDEHFVSNNKTSQCTIRVEYNNGTINVTGITPEGEEVALFENVKDTSFTAGKIGVGTEASVGYFSNIHVVGNAKESILAVADQSIENNAVDVERQPEIRVGFNMPINVDTVTKENVFLKKADGTDVDSNIYDVSADGDSAIIVKLNQKLDTETQYILTIGKGVKSYEFNSGMINEHTITFTTIPPAFKIESYNLYDYDNNPVTKPSDYVGAPLNAKINITNNYMADEQSYFVIFALVGADNSIVCASAQQGVIAKGDTEEVVIPMSLSAGVTDDVTYKVYAWDSPENLKPLSDTEAIVFDDSDFINIDTDIDKETVTISGILPNNTSGRYITLLVLNPGKTISDVINSENAIQNVAEIITSDNGQFSYTFKISLNDNSLSGTYSVYMGGDDFSAAKSESYYYALKEDRQNAIADINSGAASAQQMMTKIDSYKDILSYNTTVYKALTGDGLGQRVLNKLKSGAFDENDEAAVQTFMRTEAILEAYALSKNGVLFDSNYNILYPDLLGLDDLDTRKSLTVYDFFQNKMTSTGKSQVCKSLLGANYSTTDEFCKKFAEYVVVFGINNCNVSGFGHINELLVKNAAEIGLDLSGYNSSRADRQLVSKGITSLISLQQYIDLYSKESSGTSGGGGNGGGGGGSSTPSRSPSSLGGTTAVITPTQPTLSGDVPEHKVDILDMDGTEWSYEAVTELIKKKIVSEPVDGLFRPNDDVTRAEFTKMVVMALELDTSSTESGFEDVPQDDWSAPYVTAAKTAGIVTGLDDTTFGGSNKITRQDAAVILVRAFKLVKPQSEEQPKEFSDMDQVSDYAVDSVQIAVACSVINGMDDGRMAPLETCSRAQAAQMIYNIVKTI